VRECGGEKIGGGDERKAEMAPLSLLGSVIGGAGKGWESKRGIGAL